MAGFNLGNLAQALSDTNSSNGVSFEGKALGWGTAEEARVVIDAINACPVLEFLNLEGNTLGVGGANGIAKALERHPELKRALWKDLFTGRMKTEIPQALESMSRGMITAGVQLSLLDCSDNALGPNGMRGLVDLLKSPTCYSLTELKLNNCGLGIQGAGMLAQSLTDCYWAGADAGRPFKLRVFIAGRNRLENDGARALADIFGKLGTLEEVAVPQNGINHDGIRALANAFKLNSGLRVLNLNDNTITPRGAIALAEALDNLQELRELNLGDCLLKSGGAVLLGEALQDAHQQLRVLNLGFNEIGPNGGMSVVTAMHNKPLIESIVLNGNMFGAETRECISEVLADAGKLAALGPMDEDDSDNEAADEEIDDDYEDDEDDDEDDNDDDDDEDDDDENEDEEEYEDYRDVDLAEHAKRDAQSKPDSDGRVNFSFRLASFGSADVSANSGGDHSTSGGGGNSSFFNGTDTSITTGATPVETFCLTAHPTVALFAEITDVDKVAAFRQYLANVAAPADYLLYASFAVLKCSAISKVCPSALAVSDALYGDCFAHAEKTGQVQRVKTFFLTQLGLLCMEDKSYRPAYDVGACRAAVRHAIAAGAMSDEVGGAFGLFLERF